MNPPTDCASSRVWLSQGWKVVPYNRAWEAGNWSVHDLPQVAENIEPPASAESLVTLSPQVEDLLDLQASRSALAESDERIPYRQLRKKLGLE